MKLEYVSRAQWGSLSTTETFIKNRFSASAFEKTTIQVHHTASIDKLDTTPNRWSKAKAIIYMQSLQWVRPELGPLPYSINFAASEDLEIVWVFEGRGVLPVGAHTAGHNRDGVGMGVFGNFDIKDSGAAAALVAAIEIVSQDLWTGLSPIDWLDYWLPSLGSVPNPLGWTAWGHRDSSPKSCPGNHLYPLLEHFTLEEDMPLTEAEIAKIAAAAADRVWGTEWVEEGIGAGTTPDKVSVLQALIRNFKLSKDIQSTVKLTRVQLTALIAGGVAVGATAPEIVAEIGRLLSGQ